MKYVYTRSDTMDKREFVRLVFDNNLYYQEGIYRTPAMMRVFTRNTLIMKEIGYLIYERKEGFHNEISSSGLGGTPVEHLVPFLTFLDSLKID